MKLIEVNKARYQRHLKIVIITTIVGLALGSLGISQSLIALFPDDSGSHFHWNLVGVVITALLVGAVLSCYRQHPFMTEVVYVWELKQVLNKIHRKMPKLEAAAKEGNPDALLAIHFSYAGSRLLWHLDDNTLTMDELGMKEANLVSLAESFGFTLEVDNYSEAILDKF